MGGVEGIGAGDAGLFRGEGFEVWELDQGEGHAGEDGEDYGGKR